jgi:predicted N-acetyltransferase YhbS
MLRIDTEAPGEASAREALLDRAFGPARFAKTSERLREGRLPVLALSARENNQLIGTVRLWTVEAATASRALLLGPLAVAPAYQDRGVGARLMRSALNRAAAAGHGAVLLVGDAPYYSRFGFSATLTEELEMPGPVERHRFLGLELRPGALAGARGLLRPAGELAPLPPLRPLPHAATARSPAAPQAPLRL